MKFGLLINKQHPAGDPIVQRFEEHLEQVRAARDNGFDSIVCGQHYLSSPFQELQTIPFLARLAAEAGDMTLGATVILLPLHNPVEIAEQVATLDVICQGRFIFGVGLGYRGVEDQAFGVRKADKVGRLVEGLEIIKRLWTGEEVHFEGKHFRLAGAKMTLQPVQKPHPPIWMAANNDPAIRRAARLADAWIINPHAILTTLERQAALYRQALAEANKPFPSELPMIKELFVAQDRATALHEARPHLVTKYQAYALWGQDRALPDQESFEVPFEELARDRFIIGDPDDCIKEISKYHEKLGVNHFIFRVHWPGIEQAKVLNAIRLLGQKVLPYFKGRH